MCDVHDCVILATILKKDAFDLKFQAKALSMTMLASRYMFLRSKELMVPFVWPMILTFQGHYLCKITFWAISQLLMGKMLPNFNTREAWVGAFQ